ncbi:MAG: hypothetical protein IKN39_01390, partial [Clostridia bacterium]|nr:hypothetical protein [Clostridia bacterium]
ERVGETGNLGIPQARIDVGHHEHALALHPRHRLGHAGAYPPVYGDFECKEIIAVLKKYNIDKVYYGHIHGGAVYKTWQEYDNISLKILSADRVNFTPILIGKFGNFNLL